MSLTTANPPATAKLLPFHTVAGVDYPVSKIAFGDADTVAPVDDVNPLPVAGAVTVAGVATAAGQDAAATLFGAVTETAPASDTASSGLNGRLQRIAQRLTSLITAIGTPFQAGGSIGNTAFGINGTLPAFAATPTFNIGTAPTIAVTGTFWQATQPVSIAAAVSVTPPANATTTRVYDFTNGQRIASGATSARTTAVAASEVMLHASARCFVRIGDSSVAATAAAGSFPLEAGEKFHCRLTSGQFVAVIRDTADGFLTVVPVA